MFDKWRKYSYAAQKTQRHRIRWIAIWIISFFLVYTILTSLVFSIKVLENDTMLPGLQKGDRFIFSSYQIYKFIPAPDISSLLHRGNIILIDKSLGKKQGFLNAALDGILRFFTAQRVSLNRTEDSLFIKRLIGLPGDEISMTNFVIRVKPKGQNFYFTEFELWDRPYESIIPSVPALWDETLPFSGNMETVTLGEDEVFVLSDDRSNTNDSRTWGPVPVSLISGKALFRYWPFTRAGIP
ncbi:MAG: signal peptidase I [Treponema sp.]|nr:signal peptidase I [Treponema sp.]